MRGSTYSTQPSTAYAKALDSAVRFEVLTAVLLQIQVFGDVMLYLQGQAVRLRSFKTSGLVYAPVDTA
jgi:hypothetical protein